MKKKKQHDRPISPRAHMIVNAWLEILHVKLSVAHVSEHLAELEEWERQKEKDLGKKVA